MPHLTIHVHFEVEDRDLLIREAKHLDPDGDFADDDTNYGAVMTVLEHLGFNHIDGDQGFRLTEWGVED